MPRWLDALVEPLRRLAAGRGDLATGRTVRKQQPTARPVEAGVRIEYTPQLDGDPDPGEVIWTWVPYEDDPSLGKDRPVVVVGRHGAALSGVALTSKAKDRRDYVDVGSGSWDSRGRPSYAKVDRLLDIDPVEVRREGAILSRRRFDAVIEAVDRLHNVAR
jgi:PemK-like, MazF-like toxin of type II toxin-antitoxin system